MSTRTLLLSSYYLPVRVLHWQDAIKMVYEGTVRVVVEYDATVSSPSVTWKVPAVIALKRSVRRYVKGAVKFSRRNVYARDSFRCQYCGGHFSEDDLTYDHVVPKSAGGRREWKNIVSACRPCNSHKGHRSCDESGMFPLRRPEEPSVMEILSPVIDRENAPEEWHDFLGGVTLPVRAQ
jgi:5-methylcytosine-specific restriction endonuclease McrA